MFVEPPIPPAPLAPPEPPEPPTEVPPVPAPDAPAKPPEAAPKSLIDEDEEQAVEKLNSEKNAKRRAVPFCMGAKGKDSTGRTVAGTSAISSN